MTWASAIGLGAPIEAAATGAASQLAAAFEGQPDLAIVFASSAYGQSIEELPQILRSLLGDCLLFGCNATGLIGGGIEEEEEPGIAILCGRLPDATQSTLHLEQATLPPLTASREHWWRKLEIGPESSPSFVLLADAATFDAESCARSLDRAYPGASTMTCSASA
jgi:small ligand-binding sensory domain FIST